VRPMSEYLIDAVPNLASDLGQDLIIKLSTAFYEKVFSKENLTSESPHYETFGRYFKGRSKEAAIQNQYEFFIQRFGGPALYSQRKGHPALKMRHKNFGVVTASAQRWVQLMREAMDEVGIDIEHKHRKALEQYFDDVALFLRNCPDPAGQKALEAKSNTTISSPSPSSNTPGDSVSSSSSSSTTLPLPTSTSSPTASKPPSDNPVSLTALSTSAKSTTTSREESTVWKIKPHLL